MCNFSFIWRQIDRPTLFLVFSFFIFFREAGGHEYQGLQRTYNDRLTVIWRQIDRFMTTNWSFHNDRLTAYDDKLTVVAFFISFLPCYAPNTKASRGHITTDWPYMTTDWPLVIFITTNSFCLSLYLIINRRIVRQNNFRVVIYFGKPPTAYSR